MKLLTIAHHKDSLYALSPQERAEVLRGANDFIDKYLKSRKLKDIYFLSFMRGTVGVWELQSGEEVGRISLDNPMAPFLDVEVIPLIEYEVGKKLRMEAIEKVVGK